MIMETLRQSTHEQRQELISHGDKIISLCDEATKLLDKNCLGYTFALRPELWSKRTESGIAYPSHCPICDARESVEVLEYGNEHIIKCSKCNEMIGRD